MKNDTAMRDHGPFCLDRTVVQFVALVNREEMRDGLNNHLRWHYTAGEKQTLVVLIFLSFSPA